MSTATQPEAEAAEAHLADHVVVLFGATGDLSRRKLLPGLFHLAQAALLPDGYRLVGASRRSRGGRRRCTS